jgi:hypothetical protein
LGWIGDNWISNFWRFAMIRVVLVDQDGKPVLPKDVSTSAELREVAEQARGLIRDCERLAAQKDPKGRKGEVPYLS